MKHRILFITTSYVLKGSSAAIRNNSLVKGLCELGYDVDVYTVKWSEELYSPFFLGENNGNINFSILPNLVRIDGFKKRVLNRNANATIVKIKEFVKKIIFFPDECYEWNKILDIGDISKYDCLITSSDHKMSHFVGLNIKKKYPQFTWLQIWGDPWNSDVNTLKLMKGIIAYYEKRILKHATKVVYVSPATTLEMQNKYPQFKDKIYYIPRGYYYNVKEKAPKCSENIFRLVYTGAISWGRNIFQLLNVLNRCTVGKSVYIVDIYGNYSPDIQEKLNSFSFVKLHQSVDFEFMHDIYSSASLLLYLSNKKGTTQIPGKFFDYMGTTKPILCLVDDIEDDISSFLQSFDKCMVVQNSEYSIAKKLSEIELFAQNTFLPDESFSPKAVAMQIAHLCSL